jgi:small neutral amino acid transporter SnatA (MarC family)
MARNFCDTEIRLTRMDHPFISIFMLLMLILSPINYLFMQFDADRSLSRVQRRRYLLLSGAAVVLLLTGAILLGQMMWSWFAISFVERQLSFGVLLFILATSMIFVNRPRPPHGTDRILHQHYQQFFLQFSIRIAPVVVVNVVLLSANQMGHSPAIFFACACVLHFFCLLVSFCDQHASGKNFSVAIFGVQKLIGLLLVMVAVEKMIGGARQYFTLA